MPMAATRRSVSGFLGAALIATVSGLGHASRAVAGTLAQPQGKVILTISGRITDTNQEGAAEFDLAMLEALGLESFTTTTPWYNGPVTFEGVAMMRLLDRVGATGESVTATALNDYSTEIPIEDFRKYRVILALKRDGAYMPVKDKGPLFIVYPYDSDPELKHQRFYSRSAWQVARLIVK
jgi:hypothetical protein